MSGEVLYGLPVFTPSDMQLLPLSGPAPEYATLSPEQLPPILTEEDAPALPAVAAPQVPATHYKRSQEPAQDRLPTQGTDQIQSNRTDFERMFDTEAPDYAVNMVQEDVDEVMDAIGWDVILEEIARGNLRNTLALRYRVPIIKFHKWLDSRVPDQGLINDALALGAESMVVKSHMVLQQDVDDAAQGGMVRAFSKRIADIASSVAPGDWGSNKDPDSGRVTGTAIQINIGGTALIPGTEVLTQPVQIEGEAK